MKGTRAPQTAWDERRRAYLVKGGSFTFGILHHSISNVFVVYPISESDSYNGGDPDGMPLCVWIVVCEITGDVHHGSTPSIETKDFIGEIDNFPPLGIGELHPISPWSCGDIFWAELLVQLGLESRELRLSVRGEVVKSRVVGGTRKGVLGVISSVHCGVERCWTVCGYRFALVC